MKPETVYGFHSVIALLERHPERVVELFMQDTRHDERGQQVRSLCKANGIAVQAIARTKLDSMTHDGRHQGVAARIKPAPLLTESELTQYVTDRDTPVLLLVLDSIQDPHNLGACIRTAEAAGVDGVVFPKDKAAELTAVARKAAAGAAERMPLYQVSNLARAIESIKQAGVWVVGTAGDSEQTIYEVDLKGPLAIVMGGEGPGMRQRIRGLCDHVARIPMADTAESLNVSVATGVCLFEARRQRMSG